jgi:NADH dehydrogenase
VLLEAPVASAGEDHVALEDGSRIATRTVVWAAGIEPPELAGTLDVPRDERGWIVTDDALRVPGRGGVWAVGDCAANPDGRGGTFPPTAQHAVRQGRAVAGNVLRALRGEEPERFRHETRGTLIGLGHRSGLADLRGRVVRGLPGWVLWRAFYLRELPTLGRSARVGLDWAVNAFTGPDLAEVPLEPRTAAAAVAT